MSTQTRTANQQTTGSSRPPGRRRVIAVVAAVAVAVAAVILAAAVNIGNTSIVSGWFPVFLFWQALVYLGAAQVLREETGGPLPPVEQAILDRILAPAVAALSASERQEAVSQGRNQPLPATIAYALAQVSALGRHRPVRTGSLPGEAN